MSGGPAIQVSGTLLMALSPGRSQLRRLQRLYLGQHGVPPLAVDGHAYRRRTRRRRP